jgi:hypothetical protein
VSLVIRFAAGLDRPQIFRAKPVNRGPGDQGKLTAGQIHLVNNLSKKSLVRSPLSRAGAAHTAQHSTVPLAN